MQDEGHAMAHQALMGALEATPTAGQPELVQRLIGTFRDGGLRALAAGRQFDADREQLAARRDLLPEAGARRLYGDAQSQAFQDASSALNEARTAASQIERAGLLGAMPQITAGREGLARQEFGMVLGDGTPDQVALRVIEVANTGSRDVLGVLLGSDYGRSYLESKGLRGRELDETITSARRVVVERINNNPTKFTESERRYARLYRSAGEMNAAIGAISFSLRSVGRV